MRRENKCEKGENERRERERERERERIDRERTKPKWVLAIVHTTPFYLSNRVF